MFLVVGLGNPEKEYANTRHNMGFNVINKLAEDCDIKVSQSKFNALCGTGTIGKEKVIIVKPQTYMNSSGESVILFKNFYKISNKNIILIYDDIDLDIGKIRIRKRGSAGTHNGMKSVTENLNTEDFPRIRIGIGMPENKTDLIDYVIKKISKEEQKLYCEPITKASKAIQEILNNGIDNAMNMYNGKE